MLIWRTYLHCLSMSWHNDVIKSSKCSHRWNLCEVNVAISRHQISNAHVAVIRFGIVFDRIPLQFGSYPIAVLIILWFHFWPDPVTITMFVLCIISILERQKQWKSCHGFRAFIAERYRPNFSPLFNVYVIQRWLVMSSSH